MKVSQVHVEELQRLEESLWVAATRYDRAYMERIFAPDFFEFGCSGHIYTREELLPAVPNTNGEIKANLPFKDFRVLPITNDVVQVTYVSEVMYAQAQICNRSSIWVRSATGWQLRFHQGTPIDRQRE